MFNLSSPILELSAEAYRQDRLAEAAAYQFRGPSVIVVLIAHLASRARRSAARLEAWAQGPAPQAPNPSLGNTSLTR